MRLPDILNRRDGKIHGFGHCPGRPVRCLMGRRLEGEPDNLIDKLLGDRRFPRWAALVLNKTIDALLHEAFLPTPYTGLGLSCCFHDGVGSEPVGAQQHDTGPPDMFLGRVTAENDRFKTLTILGGDCEADTCTHAENLHKTDHQGIPLQDSLVSVNPLAMTEDT